MRPLLLASTLAVLSWSSTVEAEDMANTRGVFDFYVSIGLGGEVDVEDSEDDLDSAFGLGGLYTKGVNDNLALGAGLSFLSWLPDGNGDEDRDRNLLINLNLRPEALIPASSKLEFFVGANFGITFSKIGEDNIVVGEIQPALGFHLGLGLGARYALREQQGLSLELLVQRHEAEHEIDGIINTNLDSSLELAMLNLGYYFR